MTGMMFAIMANVVLTILCARMAQQMAAYQNRPAPLLVVVRGVDGTGSADGVGRPAAQDPVIISGVARC